MLEGIQDKRKQIPLGAFKFATAAPSSVTIGTTIGAIQIIVRVVETEDENRNLILFTTC